MKSQTDAFRQNTMKTLLAIYRRKEISRIEISNQSGLTPASVTHTVNFLLEEKQIIETGEEVRDFKGSGRSRKLLSLNATYALVMGIEFNNKGIFLVLTDLGGSIVYQKSVKPEDYLIENINKTIRSLIQTTLEKFEQQTILGVGIAIPGHLDETELTLISNNPLWRHFNLNIIKKDFDIPIIAENNIESMALAQYLFKSETSPERSLFIHVGPGLFCSFFDGQELKRKSNHYIGEIGHTVVDMNGPKCECGKNGCLQTFISDTWLINNAKFLYNNSNVSTLNSLVSVADQINLKVIADGYQLGDSYLKHLLNTGLTLLATSIANTLIQHDSNKIFINSELLSYHNFKDTVVEVIKSQLNFIPTKTNLEIDVLSPNVYRGAVGAAALICLIEFIGVTDY